LGAPTDEDAAKTGKGIYIYIAPGEDLLVPTYIHSRCPKNIVLKVADKSGVATRQKIHYGAGVIDWNYEGEIVIQVFNPTNKLVFLEFGQGLAQIIPEVIDTSDIEVFYSKQIEEFSEFKNQITRDEFFEGNDKQRGETGFGSTSE
jgi:dUTPase